MSCCSSVLSGSFGPEPTPDVATFDTVQLASTANVDIATLAGGVLIDGVACVAGTNVLLRRQTNPDENGVYLVAEVAPSTRAAEWNGYATNFVPGRLLGVERGDYNGGLAYVVAEAPATSGSAPTRFVEAVSSVFGRPLCQTEFDVIASDIPTWRDVSTSGILAAQPGEAGHIGIMRLGALSASTHAYIDTSQVGVALGQQWQVEVLARMVSLSTVAERAETYLGLTGLFAAGANYMPTAVAFFVDERANWLVVSKEANVVLQTVDTGVPVVAGAWTKLTLRRASSTADVECFVNEQLVGAVAAANLPAGPLQRLCSLRKIVGSSNERDVDLDWYELRALLDR